MQDALPFWRSAALQSALDRRVGHLFDEHVYLEPVLAALRADHSSPEEFRKTVIRLAEERGDPGPYELNSRAWYLVDPSREDESTDVALALRLMQRAIELAPKDPAIRDTYAWALLENGYMDRALSQSAKALELAPEDERADFQGYLDRIRSRVEAIRREADALADPPAIDSPGDDR